MTAPSWRSCRMIGSAGDSRISLVSGLNASPKIATRTPRRFWKCFLISWSTRFGCCSLMPSTEDNSRFDILRKTTTPESAACPQEGYDVRCIALPIRPFHAEVSAQMDTLEHIHDIHPLQGSAEVRQFIRKRNHRS